MPTTTPADPVVEEDRVCPECSSEHLVRDYARGELVCDSCGLVISESAIDEGPEWAAYSVEENDRLARTGAPRSSVAGASGLTTVIPLANRDARGNTIPLREREKFYRMRKLQRHSGHSRPGERSLPETIRSLDRVASLMGLPRPVKDEAGFICKKALEKGLVRGRSIEAIVAAAVYAACRIDGVPRTLDELQQVTGVRKKTIGKAYGALLRTLTLRVPPSRPSDYVSRFCSRLGLSIAVEAESQKILKELEKIDNSMSLSPSGTAAAAIYLASLASGERRPQKAIAKIAGVSEVTLRNRFQFMEGFMQQLTLPRGRAPKVGTGNQLSP
ncbi:MAG: transcription initiation factor IIB [Methanobacteriota archaeon]|nr:MAG: transcription initiation factor IIB [Euryarchaeota archaeon]TLZ66583.1 MAG: transcription initiation factor IIB [Euryarchaeota archaeon]